MESARSCSKILVKIGEMTGQQSDISARGNASPGHESDDIHMRPGSNWLRERMFEVITLLLAVVAIVFAAIQYHDARTQLDRLQAITASIQTQYVGEFPVNLDKIIDVINSARERGELDIMTDFAGYAIYSRNDRYRVYFNSLLAAHQQRSVRIKMMLYDKDLAEKAFRIQFKSDDFEEERKIGFRDFFRNHPPEPPDYASFLGRILSLQAAVANELCQNGIEVRRVPTSQKYLFFLWQTNNPEAVFAFRNEAERNREISFHSLDPKLTEIFRTVFDQTWESVDPKKHPELVAGEDSDCGYFTAK
jgi:hypothetical protein